LCLIFEPVTFDELLDGAFDMLRHCSCDNASVLLHMLEVIDNISKEARSFEVRQELNRHVDLIYKESGAGELIDTDREGISLRCTELTGLLLSNVS